MEKIVKSFRGIIKAVDEKNYTVDVIVSTEATDRQMESVSLEAYKKRLKVYKEHPILLVAHDYSKITNQIGEALSIKITQEGLMARFKYYVGEGNIDADWSFKLASKGIAAYSVGFISHEAENTPLSYQEAKDSGKPMRIYKDVELLEISQVLIPANRDAVQDTKRSLEHTMSMETDNKIDDKYSDVTVQDWVPLAVELCTKALGEKELFPVKHSEKKELSFEEIKKGIESDLKIIVNSMVTERLKTLVPELFQMLKDNQDCKKEFKSIIQESIEDIASEGFYDELIFGKQAKGQPNATHAEIGNALKDIARNTKP